MDILSRKKEISDLDLFIKDKQKLIDDALEKLEWNVEGLSEVKCRCSFYPGHWLPASSLSEHQDICKYVEEGYLKEDLKKELQDSGFFYEKSANVMPVLIDSAMQEKVLSEKGLLRSDQYKPLPFPQTVDRWSVQLTPEQRLAMYDHVVEIAKAREKQKNISLDDLMLDFENKGDQDDKPKSKLELLAEMRDYKRRRQSYRAKNVHITKKSYTEIMKEVIENQMTYLVESSKQELSEKEESASDMQRENADSTHSSYHEKHSEYRTSSRKRHHSREEYSEGHSSHRKKHKKHRSRSRSKSPSRHKHKSHKHKKSYD